MVDDTPADTPVADYAYSRKNTKQSGDKPKDPNRRQGVIARPNTSKNRSPRAIHIRLRQRKALELRLAGKTYEQIAKALKVGKSQAERDVINVMADMVTEPAAQVFRQEMARLDALLAGHYEAACNGDNAAAYVCLRITELRGRFMGWDRPDVTAKLTVSDVESSDRHLDISFVLPSGERRSLDDMASARSYAPPPPVPVTPPRASAERIRPGGRSTGRHAALGIRLEARRSTHEGESGTA